ncbi:MAG: T9SS type A sorting domain-containing protein [Flavobacteriales bacterium]|nr:T9SS type A sorting domain-containing protein [Flavobacteriales bacterium]
MQRRTNFFLLARAAFLFGVLITSCSLHAQGLNNLWMGGVEGENPQPFGGTDLDFFTGELVVSYINRDIDFSRTCATITDSNGNLLFSTNGAYIANAAGDTMLNGACLNPGPYSTQYPNGLHITQAALIIPLPEHQNKYYVLHNTIDSLQNLSSFRLYLSVVDMDMDGGMGGVVSKNEIILSDTLIMGKLTAVRHANGRDWWAICHRGNSSLYYKLLITPEGISGLSTQDIGVLRPFEAGQVCFSPDGSRFAYYWSESDLDVLQFDRCSGEFFNPVHIPIADDEAVAGVAFSPNSQLLYVSSYLDAYQFDISADDIASSMVHIAEWDTFYSPFPPFATVFDMAQLAPDGKIYISTANGTKHLHVINDPDVPGLGCNLVQHQLELPSYFANSLPNHPNYHLGPVDGSICDSLGINVGLPERRPPLTLAAYPNPSHGVFTLSYEPQPVAGDLQVRDISGRLVLQETIPAWSQVHKVAMEASATGLYQCELRWGIRSAQTRVLIEGGGP